MDRYQRVEKPKAETPIDENEIRITSQGRMRSYITYAMTLLQEKGSNEIVFKAMGRAINKTVTIVELIKRRIVGLHQNTQIGSTDITDMWEPLEEGLLPLETTRHVSMITITLSKKELNTSSVGYQPPLPADQVKASTEFDHEGEGSPNGRGRGRGGRGRRGNGFVSAEYEDGGYDHNRGYARGSKMEATMMALLKVVVLHETMAVLEHYGNNGVDLKEIASLIETGSYTKEVRRILRAIRLTFGLRRKLTASVLSSFLDFALQPGSEPHARLSSFLPKEDEHDMEVDTATSAVQAPAKHLLPELEIYELTGDLAEIRGNLLALHRIATLHHDELGQETLLNLLLRNYLHYNLYDQAEKLRSKAPRFEAHSNQQFCRYLFYLGQIRTIQLEYTDAKESLLQAARKAPVAARGFRIQCNKWAILVRLLLGEIPERTIFMQKGMEKALRPYFELTNAVRIGDLELFRTVAEKFASTFSADKTHNLIVRLRHNVIRTGLRNISISYSRISLADVAEKLRLNSETPVADAESIVAKAIRDGAIDATLDHANGWMVSKETGDIYSTNEPQIAFHSRIAFCLNMHNDAVRALRYPPNTHKEKESAEKRRERQQQEQELAKHIAEEDDDDF
ncbi:hypothetical protein COLO4_26099 [Corchorus olitorius]|uniref:PCI domain-containing protein n=1 Tax=Corchorus olitorius TaxID=93759 RepID=A0A1R3HYP8_9ROSI|nr:hypothetical protein COLO4_26099 [Corchorus olitorius]